MSTRYDRTGEPLEVDEQPASEHTCDNGYLGLDHQGRPYPCPTCRPHLVDSTRPHWTPRAATADTRARAMAQVRATLSRKGTT